MAKVRTNNYIKGIQKHLRACGVTLNLKKLNPLCRGSALAGSHWVPRLRKASFQSSTLFAYVAGWEANCSNCKYSENEMIQFWAFTLHSLVNIIIIPPHRSWIFMHIVPNKSIGQNRYKLWTMSVLKMHLDLHKIGSVSIRDVQIEKPAAVNKEIISVWYC